jgi:hypothetical protein
MFCAPVVPRSPIRFAGPRSTASKLDGFSRTVSGGASEKCAKTSTNVHMAFTTFPQARKMCKWAKNSAKTQEFEEREKQF